MTDLKITQQELENRQILITIEVPEKRVDKAMRDSARKLARRIRIPGFRPGKAPYHVVLGRFGREAILEEAAESIGNSVFAEALEVAEIEPFAPGQIKDVSFDPLIYQIEIPLPPQADAGAYRDIRVDLEGPSDEAVEGVVQEQLDSLREQHKVWEPSADPIAYGDLVTISFKLTVDDEVVLENDDWDIVPDEQDYTLTPEFDAAFIGMTAGESKAFTAVLAEDSAWPEQEGAFEIEVKDIQRQELPEWTDELAQEVNEEFETFDELHDEIHMYVLTQMNDEAKAEFENKVMEVMVEQATLNYPPAAITHEVNVLFNEQENLFKGYGFENITEFLRMQDMSEDAFRETLEPRAKTRLERRLALNAVVEKEQFEISDYELDQYTVEMMGNDVESLEMMRENIAKDESYADFIAEFVKRRRATRLLLAIAKGEDVPAPGEHPVLEAPPEPEEEEVTDEQEDEAALGEEMEEEVEKQDEGGAEEENEEEDKDEESESASQSTNEANDTLKETD